MGIKTILLETSGRPGWVALADGSTLLATHRLDESRRHNRDLAPAVAQLLANAGWRPADVEAVAVSLGPGGYTGLRVGVMSAKAFAFATGCRILGADTFAALAHRAPPGVTAIEALADAQQGKVYHRRYVRTADGWDPTAPLDVSPANDWLARRDAYAAVTGPGVRLVEARLPAEALVPPEDRDPHPEGMLAVVAPRLAAGHADDVFTLAPVYLRASSAEENFGRRS